MITDQFGVFFNDTAAAASMTSKVVNVMPYAGRNDPVFISILTKGNNSAALGFTVKVQQSADNATFTDVESFSFTKTDELPAMKAIRLPLDVKKKHVRLAVAVSGTTTGITVFAGITHDHFAPYDKGQYISKGKVVA